MRMLFTRAINPAVIFSLLFYVNQPIFLLCFELMIYFLFMIRHDFMRTYDYNIPQM